MVYRTAPDGSGEAWNDGYSARFDCKPREDNPYTHDLKLWDAWNEGWWFAESEAKTM